MPYADIAIAVIIVVSALVGFMRGFMKEAMSVAALLFAIWAALNFGDDVGQLSAGWLSSADLQIWFGGFLVFVVIVTLGGLVSWGVAKLVRLTVLSGTDRALGLLFGFCRGAVLIAFMIIAGQLAELDEDNWWRRSVLIPYGEVVADWLRVMAPKGLELIQPSKDVELPLDLALPGHS